MKKWKLFLVLFLAVLMNVYCVNDLVFAQEPEEVKIEGTLTTDKGEYTSKDSIIITLEAKNTGTTQSSFESEVTIPDGYTLAKDAANKKSGTLDAGGTDSLVVTVVPKSKEDASTNGQQQDNGTTPGQPQKPGKNSGTHTGVQNNKVLWIVLGVAGALGIVALIIKGKKGKETLSILLCLTLGGSIIATNTNEIKAQENGNEVKVATKVKIDGKEVELNGVIRYNSATQSTPDPQPVIDIPQETFIKKFNKDDVVELEPGIEIMKGEILIITDNEAALKEEIAKHNGKVVGHILEMNLYQVEVEGLSSKELEELVGTFESYDWVKDASLNYMSEIDDDEYQLPDDYPTNSGKYAYEAIDAPKAWEIMETIGTDNLYRPEIIAFEALDIDVQNMDDIPLKDTHLTGTNSNNHGINVTGIISAEHNDYGIPGMVPNSDIIYYTITAPGTSKEDLRDIDMFNLLNVAITRDKEHTVIINMSAGNMICRVGASNGIEKYVKQVNKNISFNSACLNELLDKEYKFLLIKSAGNDNGHTFYQLSDGTVMEKSDYEKSGKTNMEKELTGDSDARWDQFAGIEDSRVREHIIIVGSSKPDQDNVEISTFQSNGDRVDILAPGEGVALLTGGTGQGTSYSAPFVAGTAGMLLSINPDLTGPQIKEIILATGKGDYYLDNDIRAISHLNSYNAVKEVFNSKYGIDNFEHFTPTITSFDICEKQSGSDDFCGYIVGWDPVDGADGYEVSYFYKSEKDEEIIDTQELQTYIPVKSENDDLTVKLRAYKDLNGKKFYTQWSDPITKSSEDIKKEYEEMSTGGFTSIVPVIREWINVTDWSTAGMGAIEYSVEWSPIDEAEGYEFFYSFELTANPEHTVETTDTFYTVGFQNDVNLNGRVRGYKTVNGEKIYTQWSDPSYKDNETIKSECKELSRAFEENNYTPNPNWTIIREYDSDPAIPEFSDKEIEERVRWLGVPEDEVVTVYVEEPYAGDSTNPNGYMQEIIARSDDGTFGSAIFGVGYDVNHARTIFRYSK